MSWRRLWTLVRREVLATLRDPFTITILITVPIGALIVFGFILSTEVKNMDLGVLDSDDSPASRRLVAALPADLAQVREGLQRNGLLLPIGWREMLDTSGSFPGVIASDDWEEDDDVVDDDDDDEDEEEEAGKAPSKRGREAASQDARIEDLLKEGQEILVQVAKEPLGTKGARLTSHVTLPGRFLVFMPTVDHIGISRKIASREERGRLRGIVREFREQHAFSGGVIIRR